MNMWHNVNFNKQHIEAVTDKAVLIKMPNKSIYKGYAFWHPSKLAREGRNKGAIQVSFNDEWTFTLKKYGQGKWNKSQVIDEKKIDAEEMIDEIEPMDKGIVKPKVKFIDNWETHKPKEIEAKEVEILDELRND